MKMSPAPALAVMLAAAVAGSALAQPAMPSRDPAQAQPGTYKVGSAHTRIVFTVSHLGFTDYYGQFNGASGQLSLDPANPAARTAVPVRRGSQRASRSGGTNTAMRPLITTPSPRNGRACTNTPQNTVPAVASVVLPATAARSHTPEIAKATRHRIRASIDPMRRTARVGFMKMIITPPNVRPAARSSANMRPAARSTRFDRLRRSCDRH